MAKALESRLFLSNHLIMISWLVHPYPHHPFRCVLYFKMLKNRLSNILQVNVFSLSKADRHSRLTDGYINIHIYMKYTHTKKQGLFFTHSVRSSRVGWDTILCFRPSALLEQPLSMCAVAKASLTLCDPMDYSPPGSSVRGIF